MVAAQSISLKVSSVITVILCLVIFFSMRFYATWFVASKLNIIAGGFVGSLLFIFSLTAVSNVEMVVFGCDFQAKFIPEILVCMTFAVFTSGVVHRVCMTACILFSIMGLYFINRISSDYHSNKIAESSTVRKSGTKKTKYTSN